MSEILLEVGASAPALTVGAEAAVAVTSVAAAPVISADVLESVTTTVAAVAEAI